MGINLRIVTDEIDIINQKESLFKTCGTMERVCDSSRSLCNTCIRSRKRAPSVNDPDNYRPGAKRSK